MSYHKFWSYLKSGVRIFGYFLLAVGMLEGAALTLVGAEILGIVEEQE